ncbi:MAG: TatD family hydrolase [SAR324 cluster bacterium]|nr:TatD family hydrolase [SAR324 cluster bacterium]
MTSFIDTHCHLDMLRQKTKTAIQAAASAGVEQIITIAIDEKSIQFVEQSVKKYPQVFGSIGIHPHEAKTYTQEIGQQIHNLSTQAEDIVAIGETGLDYHYMHSEKKIQQKVFSEHLELAAQLQMPVVLHTREAEEDTMAILKENSINHGGVAHSFTGSLAMAKELLDMGWYIGVNGIVTFPKAEPVREVMCYLPADRLLLETDAPFLAPKPFRGKPNDPAKIPIIAEFVAKQRNISIEDLASQTTENAQRLFQFGIK